jgi:hypothetical protein
MMRQGCRDEELLALEAEIFQRVPLAIDPKIGTGYLGAVHGREVLTNECGLYYPNSEHGKVSFYVENDGDIDPDTLVDIQSCQSGGMYGETTGKNTDFIKRSEQFRFKYLGEDTHFNQIVHKTNNKEGVLKECSISLFIENTATHDHTFLAYLFTTNDPLAMDNFNCFRGESTKEQKPGFKCVEQLVFCEAKIKLGIKMANDMDDNEFFRFVMTGSPVNHNTIAGILKNDKLNEELNTISQDPQYAGKDKDALRNEKLLEKSREFLGSEDPVGFKSKYIAKISALLSQTHDLPPFKNYKAAGRGVFAVGDYLKVWDSISLMCAISARMYSLSRSRPERSLVASMVPKCVVECSKDDNIWGYRLSSGKTERNLGWLTKEEDEGRKRMLEIVEDAVKFQDSFIEELASLCATNNINAAFRLLFSSDLTNIGRFQVGSVHKLGLSERIIQSIWTNQVKLPDALITKIENHFEAYGLRFNFFDPTLKPSSKKAFKIASSIGKLQQ